MTYKTNCYTEDDLVLLSALQHIIFCERQCALIHIEQIWEENLFTAEGRIMHDKVDTAGQEKRRDIRIEYGVPLRSLRLGLIGKADVVEFHRQGDNWHPFPVEYKRGKPKRDNCDKVQLCAQAICLEEMLNCNITEGSLFYGTTRRRQDVVFDTALRTETEETAKKVHELISTGITPKPEYSKKCKSCSLEQLCMPKMCGKKGKAGAYLLKMMESRKE
ncbi:MAG: PD-(D/E)XK nuclease superfamily protein [Candidatus Scalindua rubra]|uniref:CRISPR-associated exonuclease Cas4 n=1 Tax=Candidatus Scalindua rubra TaxID=1872076 RepID=A0A1E3XEG8_9BACT|nr:MAG: PD-(D/E)XK nuclease superfamily protein [Candidatus Scalindua rubra]